MTISQYWRLIMMLTPLHEGGHQNVSSLGYADLATEFEDATLESFNSYTFGKTSDRIIMMDVLPDHSVICKFDDESPLCIITPEEQGILLDFQESIFNEYIRRLEEENGKRFGISECREFNREAFAEMIKQKSFTLRPFIIAGYFEHPSTIEDSKAELSSALRDFEEEEEE
ncbi:MAG: hypothetical protein EOP48_05285 [Sphingobacteriales bacterium]|nr:MAG: hypothetical protein EOP48_05285 [Sphingobacteriales bacterium]